MEIDMAKLKVSILVPIEFSAFHLAVPQTIFDIANNVEPLFDVTIVTETGDVAHGDYGLRLPADGDTQLLDDAHVIVLAGWHDLKQAPKKPTLIALRQAYERQAYIVGLCYGAYPLAYSGLLDGKRAATHWLAESDFAQRFPKVKLDLNALYVSEGHLITSAGTGASLDCCLHVIRQIYGAHIANKVARAMVVAPHREGGQAQFIEHPLARADSDTRINQLLDDLLQNLSKAHTVDGLARSVAMSRRTFTRRFQQATGSSVMQWLRAQRLNRVCELLESTTLSIDIIADQTGFNNAVNLRRHFVERFHTSPSKWRKTFRAN